MYTEIVVTAFCLTMEVEVVTHVAQYLTSASDTKLTHGFILTDIMNLLLKEASGTGCSDWHMAMHSLWQERLQWITALVMLYSERMKR